MGICDWYVTMQYGIRKHIVKMLGKVGFLKYRTVTYSLWLTGQNYFQAYYRKYSAPWLLHVSVTASVLRGSSPILGMFAKLWKATVSIVWVCVCVCVSVCLSTYMEHVAPNAQILWNFMFEDFLKICWETWSLIKFWQAYWILMKTYIHLWLISHWILLRMRNVWDKVVEKINKHTWCLVTYFQKLCHLWDNVK